MISHLTFDYPCQRGHLFRQTYLIIKCPRSIDTDVWQCPWWDVQGFMRKREKKDFQGYFLFFFIFNDKNTKIAVSVFYLLPAYRQSQIDFYFSLSLDVRHAAFFFSSSLLLIKGVYWLLKMNSKIVWSIFFLKQSTGNRLNSLGNNGI